MKITPDKESREEKRERDKVNRELNRLEHAHEVLNVVLDIMEDEVAKIVKGKDKAIEIMQFNNDIHCLKMSLIKRFWSEI